MNVLVQCYIILYVFQSLQTSDFLLDVDVEPREAFKRYETNKERKYREQLEHADKEPGTTQGSS